MSKNQEEKVKLRPEWSPLSLTDWRNSPTRTSYINDLLAQTELFREWLAMLKNEGASLSVAGCSGDEVRGFFKCITMMEASSVPSSQIEEVQPDYGVTEDEGEY